jgi:transposase
MVVLKAMERLGLAKLIDKRASRERSLVLAMIANRIIEPKSKLATTSWWRANTLAEELGLEDADEDGLYAAMDWVYDKRRAAIERMLAARHLHEGDLALYDLSSSCLEGSRRKLGMHGCSRDRKRGKLQINFGMLADRRGRPIGVEACPGNQSDATTFCPMVERVRRQYGLKIVVMVGDRGMLGSENIEILKG